MIARYLEVPGRPGVYDGTYMRLRHGPTNRSIEPNRLLAVLQEGFSQRPN